MKFKNIIIHDAYLPKDFILFLKENNAYEKYIHNLSTIKSNNFNKKIKKRDLILYAFKWKTTKEGHIFWEDIYHKWMKKY